MEHLYRLTCGVVIVVMTVIIAQVLEKKLTVDPGVIVEYAVRLISVSIICYLVGWFVLTIWGI